MVGGRVADNYPHHLLLRGLGYESNDASVLTNVSGDHLDLQGLHTLPELAEVKAVICRITSRRGAVVLNAEDDLVAAESRHVKAPVWWFSLRPGNPRVRRALARGGRAYVLDDGWLLEREGSKERKIIRADEIPATILGAARHNVANALAASAGARALGFTLAQVKAGLADFRSTPDLLPGRMNLYRLGNRLVFIDYAHNVAGLDVLLSTAEALVGKRGRRKASLSVILGSAGDRPDDYLHQLGMTAGSRADEVALKEMIPYLRGRTRESVIGELSDGLKAAGVDVSALPIYYDELDAIRGELTTAGRLAATEDGTPRVLLAMCHRLRDEINSLLTSLGATSVERPEDIADLRRLMDGGDEPRPAARRARPQDRPAPGTRRRSPRSAA